MNVFWRQGYEGASLNDLTAAMGINRPSLYAAFGDKEALFRKALDRYEAGACYVRRALQEPTARGFAETLLEGAAESVTNPQHPKGCLVVQGALAGGAQTECVRKELIARRDAGEKMIRQRLKRARAEGDLPADANPADLARYLVTVARGLAVQAAGGATRTELRRVIQLAMRAWPETKQ
ncbi:MAG: TetR/AcrR family transcriptional regulator [Acidobacteriota bacterium]